MSGNTVFISYILVPSGLTSGNYSKAIHCNYFKKISLGIVDPYIQEVSFNFPNISDFKFLTSDISNGTGYTVSEIHALVQIVSNSTFDTYDLVTPDSTAWKQYDITSQLTGHVAGTPLTGADLTSIVFKISLLDYLNINVFKQYNLDYLNYPSTQSTADDEQCFGDESYFLGNVITEIKAIAYTTDLSISLPLNEFNTSSNLTWEGESVAITEIGIYDANKNLVGIGKLNNPIEKDSTITRTIKFELDF